MDIGLPDVDGYDLARQVRCNPENDGVYLVALTGFGRAGRSPAGVGSRIRCTSGQAGCSLRSWRSCLRGCGRSSSRWGSLRSAHPTASVHLRVVFVVVRDAFRGRCGGIVWGSSGGWVATRGLLPRRGCHQRRGGLRLVANHEFGHGLPRRLGGADGGGRRSCPAWRRARVRGLARCRAGRSVSGDRLVP